MFGSSFTNENGVFSIKPVPSGVYSFRLSNAGKSAIIENLKVNPKQTVETKTITTDTSVLQY